jgi:hypothetical protein
MLNEENLLFAKQHIARSLCCSGKASKFRICDEESQGNEKVLGDKSVCRAATGHSVLIIPWDRGDTKCHALFKTAAGATILHELWWLSKSTTSAFRHLLVVKFGTHNYSYFIGTATYLCCPPANFIQQRRIIAALLHFLQYKLLSSVVERATWQSLQFIDLLAVDSATQSFLHNLLNRTEVHNIFISISI